MLLVVFILERIHLDVDMRLVNVIHELKDLGVFNRAAVIPMTPQCGTGPRWVCMAVKFDKYFCRFVARCFQGLRLVARMDDGI